MKTYVSAYRAEIDGLRAFAVLSVVAFHAFPDWVTGGFIGVDVFFVISGFLITSHILEKLDEGRFSFSDFFQRRIRRIFPALITVMVSSLLFGWLVLLSDEYNQLGKHVASGTLFVINFVLSNEVGYFDLDAELKPMLHLWSLAVEEQFYIIWPLAVWFSWKRSFNLLALTLLVFSLSFLFNIAWVETRPTETFFWPFSRFWELSSGSLLAWLRIQKRQALHPEKWNSIPRVDALIVKTGTLLQSSMPTNLLSLAGLLILLSGIFLVNMGLPFPSTWALLPVTGALLIIGTGSRTRINRVFFMNPVSVWFGLISYPLYLWHWPILSYLLIIEDETPHITKRIAAIALAIVLAWLTYRFIEKPIRFGSVNRLLKPTWLTIAMFFVGYVGFIISIHDFTETNTAETVLLRKGMENRVDSSSRWYEGKDDWLFLGNSYSRNVEKFRLSITPNQSDIENLRSSLLELSEVANITGTQVALLIGPNKSSIYPEFLPDKLTFSEKRYFSFYSDALNDIPDFTLQDPTEYLLQVKGVEGNLYYRTDTHWNSKGAFLAYKGFSEKLGLPIPTVRHELDSPYEGDLVEISRKKGTNLHGDDSWKSVFDQQFQLKREEIPNLPVSESFGAQEIVHNSSPLLRKRVWVIGDSFTTAQRPYINATFAEVHYLGHWDDRFTSLPTDLESAEENPDIIILIRVERSF